MDRPGRGDSTAAAVRRARLPLYCAFSILAVLISAWLGKELAWDTLNYHLYAGFSALHDRFQRDYFAAGPQAYLNPYAYVPFYLLVRSGLPALAIASVLAAVQGCVLWLTFELALATRPAAAPRVRIQLGLGAVALALTNPVLLQQFGSSFADIATTLPVLGGWLLLTRTLGAAGRLPASELGRLPVIGAGLLLGAATALKLTNAVPAVASLALVCFVPQRLALRARWAVLLCGAMAVGFLLVAAPWAWRLQETFGNPFFPLFNHLFRSSEFSTEPLKHYRFIPASLTEALLRPFAMVRSPALIHEELRAPDARYALLLVLAALLALRSPVRSLWRRSRARASAARPGPASAGAPSTAAPAPDSPRVELALAAGLVIAWILWLASSGNSRYFLPMACLTAVLISTTLNRLCAGRLAWHGVTLAVMLAACGTQLVRGADVRWSADSWDAHPWFEADIAPALEREQNLYLIMGVQSDSFLAPFLPARSGFIDVWGEYVFDPDGPNGVRIRERIAGYWPQVRVMLRGDALHPDTDPREPHLASVNDALQDYGLEADPAACERIVVHGLHAPERARTPRAAGRGGARASAPPHRTVILACRVLAAPRTAAARAERLARRAAADRVFEHLERACPQLFQPRGLLTQHLPGPHQDIWQRLYLNTDLTVWVSEGRLRFRDTIRGDATVDLGAADAWARAPLALSCGRRSGHAFARPARVDGERGDAQRQFVTSLVGGRRHQVTGLSQAGGHRGRRFHHKNH